MNFIPIKALRKSAGLTQAEAGKLVNLTEGSWAQAENGHFKLDPAKRELFELKVVDLVKARQRLGL